MPCRKHKGGCRNGRCHRPSHPPPWPDPRQRRHGAGNRQLEREDQFDSLESEHCVYTEVVARLPQPLHVPIADGLPFTISQKRATRTAAVAMVNERSRKAWTNRRSSSVNVLGSPVRSWAARRGLGGPDRLAGTTVWAVPLGAAGGSRPVARVSNPRQRCPARESRAP